MSATSRRRAWRRTTSRTGSAAGAALVRLILAAAAALPLLLSARGLRLYADLRGRPVADAVRVETLVLSGALALLGGLLLATLRLRPSRRTNLAVAAVSSVAMLYVFELLETVPGATIRRAAEKRALIDSLNRAGNRAYGGVKPATFIGSRDRGRPDAVVVGGRPTLPLAGISHRLTVECREGERGSWMVFPTDEHGFNNPPGLWGPPPIDLAAVGDSFTAGWCVPPDLNMVAALRQRYPSSLDVAMPGNGPLMLLALVREYVWLARPRIVLWCHFGGNDMRDLRAERTHPILVRYLEEGFRQGLPEQQAAMDAALQAYYDSWPEPSAPESFRVRLRRVLTLGAARTRLGLTFPEPADFVSSPQELETFRTILTQARRSVAGWGGRLYFVYLPAWSSAPGTLGARVVADLDAFDRRQVLSAVAGLGLPIIDLTAAFASDFDPASLFACPGCHYSTAGYQVAASSILTFLEREAAAANAPSPAARSPDAAPAPSSTRSLAPR